MKLVNKSSKQYTIVLGANILSMGLGFFINIIGTNIMITTSYGFYKAFVSSLLMLASFSILGFHYTLGRQFAMLDTREEKKRLNSTGIMVIIGLSLVSLCIVLLMSKFYHMATGNNLPNHFMVASLFTGVIMFQYYIQQKLQGENRIVSFSIMTVLPQLFIMIFFLIIMMKKQLLEINLAVAVFILSNLVVLIYFLVEQGITFNIRKELKKMVQANSKFGLQLYFGSLFSVTIAQFLGLLVAELSGLEEYAFYSLGVSFAAPMTLVAASMGTVQFKKNVNADHINKKELLVTIVITSVVLFIYYIFLNNILNAFISEKYVKAISYANILVFYYTMMGIGDYFNRLISSKGNGKLLRNGAMITGVILIIFSGILIPMYEVNGLIFAQIVSAIVYVITMYYSILSTGKLNKER
ncbi:oligosaccharide flippase family protein [Bacillus thuringiensis]|uniref:lipopolysaccharide biosynthesis protein n=1 Tax=Bacillus thuringiensis TaxID=1428 RepID=UPI00345AA435